MVSRRPVDAYLPITDPDMDSIPVCISFAGRHSCSAQQNRQPVTSLGDVGRTTGDLPRSSTNDGSAPFLALWAEEMERGRWPGWITDADLTLRYASTELKRFMSDSLGREIDDEAAGVGENIFAGLLNEAWRATISPESLSRLMPRVMGYLQAEFGLDPTAATELLPEPLRPFVAGAPEATSTGIFSDRFDYTVPNLPPFKVEFLLLAMRDVHGDFLGSVCLSQMGVRPTLVSLLARGDERMYERMAKLQEPRRCQGAILFADLQGSTRLSRTLPTSTYFSLIRALATQADRAIASNNGVVGKHAGDGVSGFFLISEDDASHVAASAIAAARTIREEATATLMDVVEGASLDAADFGMNIGLHWGASIFMGQLVPGGRLDVTALGDSVNECARIQEAAGGGTLLASKGLVEHLSEGDAARLGVDLGKVVYRPISEVEGVSDKAARDAGLIPVTKLA